jgi:hypothetical protein
VLPTSPAVHWEDAMPIMMFEVQKHNSGLGILPERSSGAADGRWRSRGTPKPQMQPVQQRSSTMGRL